MTNLPNILHLLEINFKTTPKKEKKSNTLKVSAHIMDNLK